MDKRVVEEKIDSLRRCINRIRDKRPESFDRFKDDLDLQDIISVNLERAVQLCVDIGTHIIADTECKAPGTMAETFSILAENDIISAEVARNMKKAVGFRNIAVQKYQQINWKIVFNIAHYKLDDFKKFVREVNNHIS